MSRKGRNRLGRPPGPQGPPPAVVTVEASRCRKCSSTQRSRYFRVTALPSSGIDREGQPFTHVVRRWTRCLSCGQCRIDRSLENRVGEASPEPVILPLPQVAAMAEPRPNEARPAA